LIFVRLIWTPPAIRPASFDAADRFFTRSLLPAGCAEVIAAFGVRIVSPPLNFPFYLLHLRNMLGAMNECVSHRDNHPSFNGWQLAVSNVRRGGVRRRC